MADLYQAWLLFHDAWLVALLLALLLPFCGIVLVLRQQVFLSAAIGQAATLGIALGLLAFEVTTSGGQHSETLALGCGVAAGCLTAVLAMRALSTGQSHLEARSVWMFLAGGSLAVVLASGQPRGLEEVQRLQLSSMLGASPYDVWAAAGGLLLTLLFVWRQRHGVLLWATDPVTAQVHGCRLFRYDLAVGLWLGGCLGFAIHATGLLFAFGVTVLPVLLARPLAGSLRAVLFLAPLLSLLVTAGALVGAHLGDLPPGQVAVAALAALLPLAVLLGRPRR